MSKIVKKFTDLSGTHDSSRTPNVGAINLEGYTG